MELSISKQCLVFAFGKTAAIADRKSAMPVLSNVLIETEGIDQVRIAATDLNISASGVFPAKVTSHGATTVPARTFYDVVRNFPEGRISLHTQEDHIHISSGRSNFKLLCLPAEDFPQLPNYNDIEFFEIDTLLVSKMIEKTAFSICNDETRSHINGSLFQGDGRYLRMVTTDGHRLSKFEIKLGESNFYNFSFVIPGKGITEIKRLLEDRVGRVSIAARHGSVFFRREIEVEKKSENSPPLVATFVFVSKLIDADFPPYNQIIPTNHERAALVSRLALLDALRRVSVVSTERSLGVKLMLSEGKIDILSDNPSVGQGTEQLDVDYQGEPLAIGFNARYFIDALSVLECDEIKIELSGPLDPLVVKDAEENFVGVVMPMRI